MPHRRSRDRRVQRTQGLLHGALASLIHEKPYDAIVVKEILGRADVGRSTFYAHFRDKDELLEQGILDMLHASETTPAARSAEPADRMLRFSLPILEHIEQYRISGDTMARGQEHTVVHEHLERMLTARIADDLRRARSPRRGNGYDVPDELLAAHVASTFARMLNWWAGTERPLPARRVHELFRALIVPALAEVLEA